MSVAEWRRCLTLKGATEVPRLPLTDCTGLCGPPSDIYASDRCPALALQQTAGGSAPSSPGATERAVHGVFRDDKPPGWARTLCVRIDLGQWSLCLRALSAPNRPHQEAGLGSVRASRRRTGRHALWMGELNDGRVSRPATNASLQGATAQSGYRSGFRPGSLK